MASEFMADETNPPARSEGAGQKNDRPQPVNLAVVEAAERGADFTAPPHPADDEVLPEAGAAPSEPVDVVAACAELSELADAAMKGRLSPSDEDRATAHMGACIAGGEASAALAAMPKLPWILGVRAIEQSWPRIGEEARGQLLAGLAELGGDHAIRLRLSVARSLAKIDPPVGAPLAGSVCRAMWDAEKGALSAEHSKLIGNVFLGRGKPWVLQLALDGLADEDADAVASCVVYSAFNVNNPPITQLSVLRYAGARLGRLHENLLALVAKGIGRWSGKWQSSLRREVPELPPALAAALRAGGGDVPSPALGGEPSEPAPDDEEGEIPLPPDLEEKLKLAIESGDQENIEAVTQEANTWRASQRPSPGGSEADDEESDENARRGRRGRRGRGDNRPEDRAERRPEGRGDERRGDERGERRGDRKERPAYVSREQEASRQQGVFNLGNALKQIESHVQQLRNELAATQAKIRKGDGPRRSERGGGEDTNFSPDELRRLVAQLESRNAELQSRVEELLADSEQRALALAAGSDPIVQYRTLLKLKLQDDYGDYCALESHSPDLVVQQHYRTLIRSVFATLISEDIALEGALPPPPPAPQPPPPPPPVVDDEEPEDDDLPPELDEIPEDDESPADDDLAEEEQLSGEPEDGITDGEAEAADEEPGEPREER
jgi:hypothetical protein